MYTSVTLFAGRLLHHLEEVTGLSLRTVEYAVLDEADRLFEMGFMEQVREAELLGQHPVPLALFPCQEVLF